MVKKLVVFSICCVLVIGVLLALKKFKPNYFPRAQINAIKAFIFAASERNSNADLDTFDLWISEEDHKSILSFYKEYERLRDKGAAKESADYYTKHNVWRKGKLIYNGQEFRVKVKTHGSQPNDHRAGNFISLAVKFQDGRTLFQARRIRFIIYERIRKNGDYIDYLNRSFDLIPSKQKLVNLKINNGMSKLYFVEFKVDDPYLEVNGLSSFRFLGYGSVVASRILKDEEDYTEKELKKIRNKEIQIVKASLDEYFKKNSYNKIAKKDIFDRYVDLAVATVNKDSSRVRDFFDFDYITSFEAARLLGGFWGHGFVQGNLYVLFDSASGKFYPILHRDCYPARLNKDFSFEHQLITPGAPWAPFGYRTELLFFKMLSQNEEVRQEKYRKAYQWITSESNVRVAIEENQRINSEHDAVTGPVFNGFVHVRRLLRLIGGFEGPPENILENWKTLQNNLERSHVEVSLFRESKKAWLFELNVDSMSALSFQKLILSFKEKIVPQDIDVQWMDFRKKKLLGSWTLNLRQSASKINLTSLFSKIKVFNHLDKDSKSVPVKHYIRIAFKKSRISDKAPVMDLVFKNEISEKRVSPKNISFIYMGQEKSFPKLSKNKDRKPIVTFLKRYPNLRFDFLTDKKIILREGRYYLKDDLVIPHGYDFVIEAGVNLFLAPNVSIFVRGGLEVLGNRGRPVWIRAKNKKKPFGVVAAAGNKTTVSKIHWLRLSGGSERWFEGGYFSGALSLYHHKYVEIKHSRVTNNHADDGLNVKYADILMDGNQFEDNFADQVDLDYCNGVVKRSDFRDAGKDDNGDGLDFSGSTLLVKNNTFEGFRDKGISIGEHSNIVLSGNRIQNNRWGVAVKDLSEVFLLDNQFQKNKKNVVAYQKKRIFGRGKFFVHKNQKIPKKSLQLDPKSQAFEFELSADRQRTLSQRIKAEDTNGVFNLLRSVENVKNINKKVSYSFEKR